MGGKRDIKIGYQKMKDFFANPNMQFVSKGGIGFGVDETLKVEDDGKGYIWLAAEMSPGGLALETFRSTPYDKRALFCAKADNVQELFDKVNWDIMNKRIDTTLGGPQIKQRWGTNTTCPSPCSSSGSRSIHLNIISARC